MKKGNSEEYYATKVSLNHKQDDFQHYHHPNLFVKYYEKQYDYVPKLFTSDEQIIQVNNAIRKRNRSSFRILHAAPNTENVEIFLDGKKLFLHLSYKQVTQYIEITSGKHQIDLYDSNDPAKSIFSQLFYLEEDHVYTMSITGKLNEISIFQFADNLILPLDETKIRFIHLAPETGSLDLAVKQGEGDVVFSNISFHKASEYLPLTPMTVNLELRFSGTKSILYPLYRSKFQKNMIYNMIAVGLVGEDPKFEVMMIN